MINEKKRKTFDALSIKQNLTTLFKILSNILEVIE